MRSQEDLEIKDHRLACGIGLEALSPSAQFSTDSPQLDHRYLLGEELGHQTLAARGFSSGISGHLLRPTWLGKYGKKAVQAVTGRKR